MTARFRDTGRGSFWGDYVYERVVPKKHFLRQLAELIDWDSLTEGLADHYKGGAEYGSVPYHPATLLKMLLISYGAGAGRGGAVTRSSRKVPRQACGR